MEERTAQTRTLDNQLFYEAFNANPIGIVLENIEGQPHFVNPFFCSMLGFSEEELRNKHVTNTVLTFLLLRMQRRTGLCLSGCERV